MKWKYEVKPARIEGEVQAPDEEAANQATTEDALRQADDAILAGSWDMWQVDDA